jgi:hypothetical protein
METRKNYMLGGFFLSIFDKELENPAFDKPDNL